jgi:predicted metal-dependent HD superfamily phosphohydrolase
VLSLLTDDEAQWCGSCGANAASSGSVGVPLRDLQLFGDCELTVLAATREEYDAHAKLVRAEYSQLSHHNYVELRIKV